MNSHLIIRDIMLAFDYLCAMEPGQSHMEMRHGGRFSFVIDSTRIFSKEQIAGIVKFGDEFGLGKAGIIPGTDGNPTKYEFYGNIADLKPEEAVAKMEANKKFLQKLREPRNHNGEGSDPAYHKPAGRMRDEFGERAQGSNSDAHASKPGSRMPSPIQTDQITMRELIERERDTKKKTPHPNKGLTR